MKRKRYTEEQIISILEWHEAGASVPDEMRHSTDRCTAAFRESEGRQGLIIPETSFRNLSVNGGRSILPSSPILVCEKTLRACEKIRNPSRPW